MPRSPTDTREPNYHSRKKTIAHSSKHGPNGNLNRLTPARDKRFYMMLTDRNVSSLYLAGVPVKVIATRLRTSSRTITRKVSALGLPPRKGKPVGERLITLKIRVEREWLPALAERSGKRYPNRSEYIRKLIRQDIGL